MKKKLFIFGTGSIADVAYYYFSTESNYEVCAFVDFKKFIKKRIKFNKKVIEFEKIGNFLPKEKYYGFVAVGYKHLNSYREKIYKNLKKKKYKLASFISTKSSIAENVKFGDNSHLSYNRSNIISYWYLLLALILLLSIEWYFRNKFGLV